MSLASRLPAPCPAPAHLCCEVDIVDELRVGQARGPARVTQQAGGDGKGRTQALQGSALSVTPAGCWLGPALVCPGHFYSRRVVTLLCDNSLPLPSRTPGSCIPLLQLL